MIFAESANRCSMEKTNSRPLCFPMEYRDLRSSKPRFHWKKTIRNQLRIVFSHMHDLCRISKPLFHGKTNSRPCAFPWNIVISEAATRVSIGKNQFATSCELCFLMDFGIYIYIYRKKYILMGKSNWEFVGGGIEWGVVGHAPQTDLKQT